MLYLSAFVLGFFGGALTVLCVRAQNAHRRKQYGLSEGREKIPQRLTSDDESKYSDIASSVDGSKAVKEFNQ